MELLTPRQRTPKDQLMHVGVARVLADLLAFDTRPCGRRNDHKWLRRDIADRHLGRISRRLEIFDNGNAIAYIVQYLPAVAPVTPAVNDR